MDLRERTIKELFQTLTGYERKDCEYYPCHFEGQDCSFCFCPFYPCLIYETGGRLKDDNIWSCSDCFFIHEKERAEEIKNILSSYPFQFLAESDWFFFNEILQLYLFGEIRGRRMGKSYTIYKPENECILVLLNGFTIKETFRGKCSDLKEKEGILLPSN